MAVQVIVVNDSGEPMSFDVGADVLLETSGRLGPSYARNLGLGSVVGRYVAFLDDDDIWLPGHLQNAVRTFEEWPQVDVYCSRAVIISECRAARVEPVDMMGDRTAMGYLFGRSIWRSRNRRIPALTIVFREGLATHLFDEQLSNDEDTWWLLTAEKHRGARVKQENSVAGIVIASPTRSSLRESQRDQAAWARRLDSLHPGAGGVHLVGRLGRFAARNGEVDTVLKMAALSRNVHRGWTWMPVVLVELLVAVVQRVRRSTR